MSTIEKIVIRENKVLKLNNVLVREISQNELIDIDKIAYMMDSYIKSKGTSTLGPMINYSTVEIDESGQPNIIIKLMVQLKSFINKVDLPYDIKLPYTFLWWLAKTRKEHEQIFQPYVTQKQTVVTQAGDLQQQYVEHIFHLQSPFNEKEENLQFAYQKLGVYAFENDIKLKGDSYTIFVKQDENEFVADVFMETLKGGDLLESL